MFGKKILVSLIVSSSLLAASPLLNEDVSAQTEEELRQERAAVQTELAEKREELEALQEEMVALEDQIDRTNEAIEANEATITETTEAIDQTKAEVATLEEEIADLEEDILKRRDILKDRAVALQKNGGTVSYIEVIFGAESFLDFIDRVTMINKITQSDQRLLEQIAEAQNEVEAKKVEVEEKLTTLEATMEELELMQAQLKEQKEQHQDNIDTLEEQKTKSEAIVSELQLEASEINQMIEDIRAREREAAAAATALSSPSQYTQSSSNASSTPAPTVSAGSGNRSNIISVGYRYIGNSTYKFGGGRSQSDIARGLFDCSGYVSWAFRQEGIHIPSSTSGLAGTGTKISYSQVQPGDLVFFNTYKTNGHVGIYVGNGKFIGSQSSTGVAIADMTSGYWANTFSGHVRRVN
ncbi:peptidoglycan DL-endopeptidase CwlO [Halolactibacillus alkaliphilus]|uniref:Peptidoglycan DL-endopeptidase CwlO n=1 Tax=Halolactibacillus alkaliphilus TaxID=442899 RepID=A0A511X1J6_9BACI|nr:C40 family peptidase [Halolactibacillus alkaliphilus]GEN56824.1 peptidoglycan DL-endopeptidase CwlO [Halolactibacillus alkaliphilus]GGN71011.1 peptidoglycan DL-endopeptidase CwlO [Halolactibacillus alkaliphilus]SFO80745.1 N-terminal domain of peptidoglycan hydrolase CwlO-containing protein [Halolactibacillus alkaliphilus]